jgi:hypothetical protein
MTKKLESVSLIDLNSFGARSGCGCCLFHWLIDMDILYGRGVAGGGEGDSNVEFRTSI